MIPVPAPLIGVAVHVVQPPGIGRVAADRAGPMEGRPFLGPVVRLALEVCLPAAQLIPEGGSGRGPGPAGVLPLRFGRKTKLPALRQMATLACAFGQRMAD